MSSYNKYYKITPGIEAGEWDRSIEMQTAWLSGLIDAEGSFSATKRSGRTTYRATVIITQSQEHEKMAGLHTVVPEVEKWGHMVKKGERSTFSIDSIVQLKYLVEYLDKNPLRSRKHIAYSK